MDRGSDEATVPADNLTRTRSGRIVTPPKLLINEMAALSLGETSLSTVHREELDEETNVSSAERNFVDGLQEKDVDTSHEEIVALHIDDHPEPEYNKFVKNMIKDIQNIKQMDITDAFTNSEMGQESEVMEVNAVGAGIGGGFGNTAELKPMKYKEAMNTPDREHWKEAVEEEHDKMVKLKVWKAVAKKDIPAAAKILTSKRRQMGNLGLELLQEAMNKLMDSIATVMILLLQ